MDDLDGLAEIARREGLWYHVDAAYGGFFVLTERGRRALAGIERADSIALDPHKGLFLPYGTGALLVRDVGGPARGARRHRGLHAADAGRPRLPATSASSRPSCRAAGAGCACGSRSRCTASGPSAGTSTKSSTSRSWATEELRRIPGVEIVAEPQLSIVAFRLRRPGLDEKALTALNRDLLARVNARARVHLTSTMLGDRFAIRICVLSFRTHADRMREGIEDLRAAISELI